MIQVQKIFLWLIVVFIAVLSSSCNDPDEVGLGVQPAGDQPLLKDTSIGLLVTYTVLEDSLISSNKLSPLFLGSLDDPETGKTYASFFTQIRLGSTVTSATFGGVTTPKSIDLTLGLIKEGMYGDATKKHHISVYQLAQAMSNDSVYYSKDSFAVGWNENLDINPNPKLALIGHLDVTPNVSSSVDGLTPQLKIPLDTAFGRYLIRKLKTALPSNDAFLTNILKGIYVVDSVEGIGNILTITSSSSLNRMTIYYNDSLKFVLELNDACARSLLFKHQYHGYPAGAQVYDHDTVQGLTSSYVQSLAGLKTKIKLPDWNAVFKNQKVSINRADLVVKVKDGSDAGAFKHHDNLLLFAADSSGKNTLTDDYRDGIGGTYDATNKQYKLNLTRHLQRILNGSVKDYGMYIVAGGSTSNARRTVLNGGLSMKINITYTQQNN